MEHGLSFLPDITEENYSAREYFENALSLSKLADEAGFKTIKMTEHYLNSYGGYCPSPLTFLASIASITKNIRLMTGCILPVFNHPIQIAANTAMVDAISNGRLDVGFARAYLPYEFSAFNVDVNNSRQKYQDTIMAVKKLWTEDVGFARAYLPYEFSAFNVDVNNSRQKYQDTIMAVKKLWTENDISFKSDFFNFDKVNSLPKPTQFPHPPIWGAAVNSRQSFAWLGEMGFNLLVTPPLTGLEDLKNKLEIYYESFIPNEVNLKPSVALSLPLFVSETQSEAEQLGDKFLSEYIQVWAKAADSWNNFSSSNYPGYTGMSQALRQNTPKFMRETNQAIIGTPEVVERKINLIAEQLNIDQILWQIDFGGQRLNKMKSSLSLFINHVLPKLKI